MATQSVLSGRRGDLAGFLWHLGFRVYDLAGFLWQGSGARRSASAAAGFPPKKNLSSK